MIVRLQPDQVTAFWEAIKHGMIVANKIPSDQEQAYCTKTLENILSDKAQVWVGYFNREGQRTICGLGVTQIMEDGVTGMKMLFLHTLYAYRPLPDEVVDDIIPTLRAYAKEIGCVKMLGATTNKRLGEVFLNQGFNQDTSLYVTDL